VVLISRWERSETSARARDRRFIAAASCSKELEGAPVTSPVYAKEACGFIDANKDKPFFLYLSFNAVHSPIVASPHWLEKFKHLDKRQQGYAALIGEADEAIGTVMTRLRDLKLEENTLLFCISDNGGASPEAEQMGLRGSEVVRVGRRHPRDVDGAVEGHGSRQSRGE
jgi:arylsulfatase A-like enzyme